MSSPKVNDDRLLVVVIASWLEPELVDRIKAVDSRIDVRYEPDLLPTPRYAGDHHGIRRDLTDEELRRWRAHLEDAEVLFDFDWHDPVALPRAAPRLRWIQATSAGIGEYLRSTSLASTDLIFTTAAGVHAIPLAEFVILSLLYFAKDVPKLLHWQSVHHWERLATRELAGQQALIVGLGRVGREVARRCAALGVDVWGMRRSSDATVREGVTRVVRQSELDDVLPRIDALVLTCPLTPRTKGLIGHPQLDALPRSAILINVSRGQVVDEDALVEALSSTRLRGAALDVFETEPLPTDNPLWDLPNVLISPHSASTVPAENGRIVDIFVDNLGRYLRGEPLINMFDRVRGY